MSYTKGTFFKNCIHHFLFLTVTIFFVIGIGLPLYGEEVVDLPTFQIGENHLFSAIMNRKAVRQFISEPMSLTDLSMILWAGGGMKNMGIDTVTHATRTIPSAMGTYPVVVYVFASEIEGLPSGIYRFLPEQHALQPVQIDELEEILSNITNQRSVLNASLVLLIAVDTNRSARVNSKFAYLEAGEMIQNMNLVAVDSGWEGYVIGGFRQESIMDVLSGENIEPIVLMAFGKPSQ